MNMSPKSLARHAKYEFVDDANGYIERHYEVKNKISDINCMSQQRNEEREQRHRNGFKANETEKYKGVESFKDIVFDYTPDGEDLREMNQNDPELVKYKN
jgi:hypothetical protein